MSYKKEEKAKNVQEIYENLTKKFSEIIVKHNDEKFNVAKRIDTLLEKIIHSDHSDCNNIEEMLDIAEKMEYKLWEKILLKSLDKIAEKCSDEYSEKLSSIRKTPWGWFSCKMPKNPVYQPFDKIGQKIDLGGFFEKKSNSHLYRLTLKIPENLPRVPYSMRNLCLALRFFETQPELTEEQQKNIIQELFPHDSSSQTHPNYSIWCIDKNSGEIIQRFPLTWEKVVFYKEFSDDYPENPEEWQQFMEDLSEFL